MTRDTDAAGLAGGLCFLAFLVVLTLVAGCAPKVQHQVTAPQLEPLAQLLKPPACPPLMPIPARMLIDIDGADVTADVDGERFLRGYVATRSCLRGAK